MLDYNRNLRDPARDLRNRQTEAERLLWAQIRRRQICNVQFYRQKPIAGFIVDFYCAAAQLVIELDGKHHAEDEQAAYDAERTRQLEALGLLVLRFDNGAILHDLDAVLAKIRTLGWTADLKSPSFPLFQRGMEENPLRLPFCKGECPSTGVGVWLEGSPL